MGLGLGKKNEQVGIEQWFAKKLTERKTPTASRFTCLCFSLLKIVLPFVRVQPADCMFGRSFYVLPGAVKSTEMLIRELSIDQVYMDGGTTLGSRINDLNR